MVKIPFEVVEMQYHFFLEFKNIKINLLICLLLPLSQRGHILGDGGSN